MARSPSPSPSPLSTVVLLILFSMQFVASTAALGVVADPLFVPSSNGADSRPRPAMVLPLVLSFPNSSKAASRSRRLLQRSDRNAHPNARMSLYDDLLINGYYTTRLSIGTPPQNFALIVDTGSSVTYVPCSTCEQCGNHQDPKFQPELSSTYQPVNCNADCNCDDQRVQCVYERQYAEMSTSSGVLGEDFISFGSLSELAPQRAVFGCENVETGDLYSQHADGIMGLGHDELSVVDQLVEKGAISDSFSLCYGGMDIGGGAMVLGGISPPSGMVFSNSDPDRSPYYNIDLKEIHVAGKRLPLKPRVFDGKYGTILDSGTTYAYLPEAAFSLFKDAIMKELHSLKRVHGPDPNYNDICFSVAGSNVSQLAKTFPAVDMVFGNGQKLSLSPENYLFKHSKVRGAYCLGVFQNGKDPTTLLGGIVVRNTFVMYDRENSKIGFWKTNCSELWERLHISGAPPLEPPTSTAVPPTLAPSGAPPYVLPGDLKVGQITFDMLLKVNYSDMKPQISDLAKYIAHELDVSPSQVHLLNFTAKGNNSLIRWVIFPEGSADYISNATATSMISRLAEHRLQLPDSFGTYQLVEWNVHPPAKRTWWQQHYSIVIMAILISLIVGLSASGVWYIWRRRQNSLTSYNPVDAAAPEQELQPL